MEIHNTEPNFTVFETTGEVSLQLYLADMKLTTLDFVLLPGYAVIVIIGFIGNSLILTVVKKKRYMHTTTNFVLVNLALADLLTLLWCILGIALNGFITHSGGVLGDFLCKFITMNHMAGISLLVAGLTLTLVSVERYNALVNPLNVNLRLTLGNVKYAIAIMWISGFIFVLPLFVVEYWDGTRRTCIMAWTKPFSAIYWSVLTLVVTVTFLVVCFCYFNIIRWLYFTKQICAENLTGSSQDEIQAKRKIVKLFITITVIFMACFFPFVIATVLDISTKAVSYKIALFLVYCSCCINPICYALQSTNYRRAFKETIRKRSTTNQTEQAMTIPI